MVASIEDKHSADSKLYLDLQMFVERFRAKVLPLMPSVRAAISLHKICDRLVSRGFFNEVLQNLDGKPENRSKLEAILGCQKATTIIRSRLLGAIFDAA